MQKCRRNQTPNAAMRFRKSLETYLSFDGDDDNRSSHRDNYGNFLLHGRAIGYAERDHSHDGNDIHGSNICAYAHIHELDKNLRKNDIHWQRNCAYDGIACTDCTPSTWQILLYAYDELDDCDHNNFHIDAASHRHYTARFEEPIFRPWR